MRLFCLASIFILNIVSVLGQESDSTTIVDWKKSSRPTILSFDLYTGYGSSNIQNEIVNKFLLGGHIDSTIKNKASDKLGKTNRFGAEANYEIKYYNLKDTFLRKLPDFRYYFGFGSYTNLSASYSEDLFRTAFYGNKQYEGQTAQFDNTNLFQSDFKKLSFGVINRENGMSVALSVISGNKHQLVNFDEASLTTSQGGGQLSLALNGQIQQSDSVSNGYLSFSGIGAAIDFSFRLLNTVNVKVTNLGFASWKRNPSITTINDTLNFDGFEIDNIFNPGELDINNELDSLLPAQKSEAFSSLLPAIFEINNVIKTDKKLQPFYGARYKINSNYFPYLYLGGFYNFNQKFKSSLAFSYGGYNKLEANMSLYYSSDKLYFGIGSNNLLGSFTKNGLGRSITFSAMILL